MMYQCIYRIQIIKVGKTINTINNKIKYNKPYGN